jgi:hypothetical protein
VTDTQRDKSDDLLDQLDAVVGELCEVNLDIAHVALVRKLSELCLDRGYDSEVWLESAIRALCCDFEVMSALEEKESGALQ